MVHASRVPCADAHGWAGQQITHDKSTTCCSFPLTKWRRSSQFEMGITRAPNAQGIFQQLPPAPPYYPIPRGKNHTRSNIWGFTVGWHECCGPAGGVGCSVIALDAFESKVKKFTILRLQPISFIFCLPGAACLMWLRLCIVGLALLV